jgi:YidC/Oxa1 family membrane protein insertase
MSVLAPAILAVYHVVSALAAVLVPLLGGFGPAAAIVVFTAAIRLALYPLNRAQMRAQAASRQARAALAGELAKLNRKHKHDPQRLQSETLKLYRANGVSLAPGVLHGLVQAPIFFFVYRMFESPTISGHHNNLLSSRLFGVGLGSHLADALRSPVSAGHITVFATLLVVIAAIAAWSSIRLRKSAVTEPEKQNTGLMRIMALLPFGSLITAAILPLATGLYLATTTLWTVVERRHLQHETP